MLFDRAQGEDRFCARSVDHKQAWPLARLRRVRDARALKTVLPLRPVEEHHVTESSTSHFVVFFFGGGGGQSWGRSTFMTSSRLSRLGWGFGCGGFGLFLSDI